LQSALIKGIETMRLLNVFSLGLGAVILAGLPGCISFGGKENDTSRASKNAAETAVYREVAEMVKLYRVCLQKNEDSPMKAKENCGMYKEAIQDLAPDNMHLDRLRDKGTVNDTTTRP
jgi:hypothetical protein